MWGIVTEKRGCVCVCLSPEQSPVQVIFYFSFKHGWKETEEWWKKGRQLVEMQMRWVKRKKSVGSVGGERGREPTMFGHTECWGKGWQVSSWGGVVLTWERMDLLHQAYMVSWSHCRQKNRYFYPFFHPLSTLLNELSLLFSVCRLKV